MTGPDLTLPYPAGQSPNEARRTALYLTMAQIPEGKVVAYGQLAELAGLG
ncbi:DNA base-flipping protein YbaZ, partial [Pseudomonas silesiensis]